MALLAGNKAKALGDIMSKHGVSGAVSADEPSVEPADEESDYEQSELELCIDDLAEAFASGDKEAFRSAVHDLVDCIKSEDEDQDEQLGL